MNRRDRIEDLEDAIVLVIREMHKQRIHIHEVKWSEIVRAAKALMKEVNK